MSTAEQLDPLVDIIAVLSELSADQNVPRNVRTKLVDVQNRLQSATESSVKIHDAVNILDELSGDINLDAYTRTQVYSLISMLEKFH